MREWSRRRQVRDERLLTAFCLGRIVLLNILQHRLADGHFAAECGGHDGPKGVQRIGTVREAAGNEGRV